MTPDDAQEKLAECRRNIDRIDLQVLALLNERARVVEIIGSVKRQQTMPVYEPKREEQVYRNVLDHNHGPLPADAVRRIFERVIDEMRNLQKVRMQS
ncbi:MAG TPA: chorismate mutase [Bryobacteraceae bacterium]|nr:chorismate mutase [Bryobacteraceae bacterium]